MDSITSTGDGLKVLLVCEYERHHNWMAFASWYSIYKNLPDALVKILCKRVPSRDELFTWTRRTPVQFQQVQNVDLTNYSDWFVIDPTTVAVSDYSGNLGPVEATSEEEATFATYLKGCGKFVLNEWINRLESPLEISDKFYSDQMSLNEYRIFKMWDRSYKTYTILV